MFTDRLASHRLASAGPSSLPSGVTTTQHRLPSSCPHPRRRGPQCASLRGAGDSLVRVPPSTSSSSSAAAERDAFSRVPCSKDEPGEVITKFIAETRLPTRHGTFRLRGYKHSINGGLLYTEPTAIICGDISNGENVAVRVHDACFTSEVLGSLKCDCAEQLQLALELFQRDPPGLLIYLQQEGRGIGLANKIAAYSLQEQGMDTVDANRALGLPDDCREYSSVKNILDDLNVKSIRLMTNNPRKMTELSALGVKITGRIPCLVQAGKHSANYLEVKRDRMDHLLDGDWCYWNHDGEPAKPMNPLPLSANAVVVLNAAGAKA